MPGDRRQILSLLRLPIPPLQRHREYQFSTRRDFAQLFCWFVKGARRRGQGMVGVEAGRSRQFALSPVVFLCQNGGFMLTFLCT